MDLIGRSRTRPTNAGIQLIILLALIVCPCLGQAAPESESRRWQVAPQEGFQAARRASVVACGDPGAGDCFECGITPFCDDLDCCNAVCAVDPFCCQEEWDCFCAGEALAICTCDPGQEPANDECASAIPIGLGQTPVTNVCATVAGPDHSTCNDFFLPGLGLDVWYTYTADFSGELTVSTCNLVDQEWDTQLAVYAGCDCGALSDPPLGCSNDALGCSFGSSKLFVDVTAGTCYTIRVGSSLFGPSGSGVLSLSPPCILDDQIPGNAVPEPEPCGDSTNGGCDNLPATPEAFTPLQCDDVIHGTAWSVGLNEDSDWYELVTIGPTLATITIETEFEVIAGLVATDPPGSGNCVDAGGGFFESVSDVACTMNTLTIGLVPGTWWLEVNVGGFDEVPCEAGGGNKNDYILTVSCQTSMCPSDLTGDGDVNAFDLAIVLGAWGPNPGNPADLDGNGSVDAFDLALVLGAWGPCSDIELCVIDQQCDDGLPCNGAETCVAGMCQAGAPILCDDANICTNDSCDPDTGECLFETIDCDDNDVCTTDQCGAVVGCFHLPILCDDNDACTNNSCDPVGGCVFAAITCDDNNPCTDDTCDAVTGCGHTPNDANTCEDGDPCNGEGLCMNGGCLSKPLNCDDDNACTTDVCSPAIGCINEPIECEETSACTLTSCDPAVGCVQQFLDCDDSDACTDECPGTTIVYTFDLDGAQNGTPSPGTGSCSVVLQADSGEVTVNCSYTGMIGDAVVSHIHGPAEPGVTAPIIVNLFVTGSTTGTVTGGGFLPPEFVQSMLDGLMYVNVHSTVFPPGEIRGQILRGQELCCDLTNGCVSVPVDCDDGDLCTTDSCDSATGCANVPVNCDDGDACTADSCDPATGGCLNTAIDCGDANACTTDSCDPASGCVHETLVCEDADPCTNDCPGTSTVFTFGLDGSQQVPPNGSAGSASCTVYLSQPTGFVTVDCAYDGLTGEAFIARIHGLSPPGVNSPIILPLQVSGGTSGAAIGSGTLDPDEVLGMLEGLTYIQINTTAFPAGEIRGQVVGGATSCCDPAVGCQIDPVVCNDGNACTDESCHPVFGCMFDLINCSDGDACTTACGGSSSLFAFDMDGTQAETGSPGTGSCSVMLEQISGFVSANCTYSGLLTEAFTAHIHGLAPPGETAPVLVLLNVTGGTAGTITGTGSLNAAQAQGMLSGLTYLNVHTVDFPSGEIRGQVTPAQELCCNPAAGCEQTPVDCDDGDACTEDLCDSGSGCFTQAVQCGPNEYCNPSTGCLPLCPGDLDLSGDVDAGDLSIMLGGWGACPGCPGDITGDGVIDAADLALLLAGWGACPVPCQGNPECDDTLFCTGVETCVEGFCESGTPPSCADGDICTSDICSASTDSCVNDPLDCNDNDACTDDSCDPASGCVHTAVDCDDGDLCTTDGCDPATGCVNDPVDCDDVDACTTDSCDPATGGCLHDAVDCDDADPCTIDTCDPATGCVHTPDCPP